MEPQLSQDAGALRLAERLLQLLDEGSFVSTYKYAVILGLMDLCLELTRPEGPPTTITTAQLARKVIELYWPHCRPYLDNTKDHGVLRQNAGRGAGGAGGSKLGQAQIVRRIERYRLSVDPNLTATIPPAPQSERAKHAYQKLLQHVEWKLVEMPLWRLQFINGEEDRFLYEYNFPQNLQNQRLLEPYWEGKSSNFSNTLKLRPGVAAALVSLNTLLRPLVLQQWTAKVAQMNGLPEADLQRFLFGPRERASLDAVRPALYDLQGGTCFYCGQRFKGEQHVDHFIPWSRYPNDGIHNLVVADQRCNLDKRDYLAAAEHVERWRDRSKRFETDLARIAVATSWEIAPERTFGAARAIYGKQPDDARLWQQGRTLVLMERPRILTALAA